MIPSANVERDTLPSNTAVAREAEGLLIQLLGGFRVLVGSRLIDEPAWYLRKVKSLVKLLVLAPQHRLHREQIMDLLWPELEGEAAANNLHKALHVARRILEPASPRNGASSYLHLKHEFVVFTLPGLSWIDVEAFQALARTARLKQDPLAYEEALHVYRGDLLPEDRCEDWVVQRREE
jgi:DNA-binding SARP family transcriptional activator